MYGNLIIILDEKKKYFMPSSPQNEKRNTPRVANKDFSGLLFDMNERCLGIFTSESGCYCYCSRHANDDNNNLMLLL